MGGQQKMIGQRSRNEITGFTASHNHAGLDLMQNCDLPPPSKVFVGPDKTLMSMNRVFNTAGKQQHSTDGGPYRVEDGESDKVVLLKALQVSQTRAREAEKKVMDVRRERDDLSTALVEEAMRLFACRQQVRLLELQVLHLQFLWLQQPAMSCHCGIPSKGATGSSEGDGYSEERSSVTWVLALTLGIGVTTVLACKYFL